MSINTMYYETYVSFFKINEEEYFLSEKDVGQKFIRTQSCKDDWSYTAENPSEEKIRLKALKLTAYNSDGSMNFSSKHYEHKLSNDWNDGNWISVEKCVKLFKDNSSKIQQVHIPMDTPLCPVSMTSKL